MVEEVPLRGAKRLGEAMVERRRRIDMGEGEEERREGEAGGYV